PRARKEGPSLRRQNYRGPTQKWPLILRGNMREVGPRNEVPMEFKPADQWIPLVILDLVSFRQATQTRTQAIAIPLTNTRKNANAGHASSVRHSFNDAGEQSFDIIEAPKDARKTQQRQRRRVHMLQHRFAPAGLFRGRTIMGLFAQIAVLLHDF